MSEQRDGGPAFPFGTKETTFDSYGGSRETADNGFHGGMSLRDWFAGQNAAGMAAAVGHTGTPYSPDTVAERSYAIADAMIAAREVRS